MNYFEITSKKIEEISNITFLDEENESLKNLIINSIIDGGNKETLKSKIQHGYVKIVDEINKNSNIQIIAKQKDDGEISQFLDELIKDHIDQKNLKKIESLEQKLINNLDENSYSELIKLKSQLNRD